MREIEFRGKRADNNEWVYGTYMYWNDNIGNPMKHTYKEKHYIYAYYCPDFNMGCWNMVEVIPKTVGQYTGLKDRKGNKIFEGDIVEWKYRGINRAVVFWDSMKAGFYLCALNSYKWHIEHTSYIRQEFVNAKNKTIIGNVTDNPELVR